MTQFLALVNPLVTIIVMLLALGIAWGKLNQGQESLATKLAEAEVRLDEKLALLASDLREIPHLYVRADVDLQSTRLMDQRINNIAQSLTDIRNDLRSLRRGTSDDRRA